MTGEGSRGSARPHRLVAHAQGSAFIRDVATLFTGTSISQLLPLLAAPVLSRVYTPDHFGELGLLMAALAILNNASSLQYAAAIMLPTEEEDAVSILGLSTAIVVFFTVLSVGFLLAVGDPFAAALGIGQLDAWRVVLPALVLSAGLFNTIVIWEGRRKNFRRIAIAQVSQSVTQLTTRIGLAFAGFLNTGLLWGTLAGQLVSAALLAARQRPAFAAARVGGFWRRARRNAAPYDEFPRYTLWQGLFTVLSLHGVVFVLGAFYGITVVGFYAFAMTVLAKPTRLIGSAVAQVFYQRAAQQDTEGESIEPLTKQSIFYMGLLGLAIYVPLLFASRPVFVFVFGEMWADAGTVAQIMAPVFFSAFVSATHHRVAIVKRRQRAFMFVTIGQNMILPLAIFISGMLGYPYELGLTCASLLIIAYTAYATWWILRLSKTSAGSALSSQERVR